MTSKIYAKTKEMIKKFNIFIIIFIVFLLSMLIELPYYIEMPGGLSNLNKKIKIENGYGSSGSLNMTYVGSIKANIPFYLLSFLNKDWDLIKIEDEIGNLSEEENDYINKIMLNESKDEAIILAYQKANKKYEIISQELYVSHIFEEAETDLKVGDKIISIDNKIINSKEDVKECISNKETIKIKVLNNNKEYIRTAKIIEIDDLKVIGILISTNYQYETDPKIDFITKSNESGPSGGLMISLAIYNSLTEFDITKNRKIAGTGTIDIDGNVGSIGGVKYKLKGAVKNKADAFLVPSGENYDEAINLKKKYNYNIEIIGVSTFDEALEKLVNS